MNFLLELRETAKACPKPQVVRRLRDAADELDLALSALTVNPTRDAMQRVNGAWANAVRALDAAPPIGGDGMQGGAMPVPKYERLAA